jgi:predicted amidohydrolase YtcJ
MRVLIRGILPLSLLVLACSVEREPLVSPDLIVVNADIHTVDPKTPRAEAFAISEGKFVAIGATSEIRLLAVEDTQVVDARGATILPGLIDGHTHLISGAGLAVGVNLSEIADKEEWLRIIWDKVESLPNGAWILGGAWDHNLSDGILPTKEMLDAVSPDNPVLLSDIDFHSTWANSLAIELAGVSAESSVPVGGEILIDPVSGELTGIFLESASELFSGAPGIREATDPVSGLKAAVSLANSLGITGTHDMSGDVGAYLSLLEEGDLTVRVWYGEFADESTTVESLSALGAERDRVREITATHRQEDQRGPVFEIGYVKLMIDGVLSTHTAMMKGGYSDNPDAVVEPFMGYKRLLATVAAAHEAQFPVAVHAIGDEGVSWTLDAFAASPRPAGLGMDRIEHMEIVQPEDVGRFAKLGIAASMQPHHATCCVGNYVVDRIGEERLPNAYVWRKILDNEIQLVLGSDWPTSPLNPLIQIADALHRESRFGGVARAWDAGNVLTFDEALFGYTQAGANMTPWADQIGSISLGKWADFVMLDQRLNKPVGRTLENRQVVATYLAGKRVFSR